MTRALHLPIELIRVQTPEAQPKGIFVHLTPKCAQKHFSFDQTRRNFSQLVKTSLTAFSNITVFKQKISDCRSFDII